MKTPVSLLLEICHEHHTKCEYADFQDSEILSNEVILIFKCEVKVRLFSKQYSSYGCAVNKKVAKQEAARKILLEISSDSSEVKALYEKYKHDFKQYSQFKPALEKTRKPEKIENEKLDQNREKTFSKDEPENPCNTVQESPPLPKPLQPMLSDTEDDDDDDNDDDNGNKSPVDIFEGRLKSAGLTPTYIFTEKKSSTGKLYSCRLELFEGAVHIEAIGSCRYEAKMLAAKCMMKGLLEEASVLQKFEDEYEMEKNKGLEKDIRRPENDKNHRQKIDVPSKTTKSKVVDMKTPASLLSEYLKRFDAIPDYDISGPTVLADSDGTWFHCKLELPSILNEKYCAEGFGLSKQQAKHKTAENMLVLLSKKIADVEKFLKEDGYLVGKDELKNDSSKPTAAVQKSTQVKNPISLLQEYLVREKVNPVYVEKQISILPPEFECKLNLYGEKYQVTGKGCSKKDAKTETAKGMLQKIAQDRPDLKEILYQNEWNEKSQEECNSSIKTGVNGLQQLCRFHNFSQPQYLEVTPTGTCGPPFTFQCEVEGIVVEASGLRKTTAKQNSASKMIERLEKELKEIEERKKSTSRIKQNQQSTKETVQFKDIGPCKYDPNKDIFQQKVEVKNLDQMSFATVNVCEKMNNDSSKISQPMSKVPNWKMLLNKEKMKSLKSFEELKKYLASERRAVINSTSLDVGERSDQK